MASRRFVARLGENVISVYETPSMTLHNQQSLKVRSARARVALAHQAGAQVPGVADFAWSPSNNVLAYFVPEEVRACSAHSFIHSFIHSSFTHSFAATAGYQSSSRRRRRVAVAHLVATEESVQRHRG